MKERYMQNSVKVINKGAPLGGAYLVTFIGAAVYFVQQAVDFWSVIVALLKALVWPAFVVYHVLQLLHA